MPFFFSHNSHTIRYTFTHVSQNFIYTKGTEKGKELERSDIMKEELRELCLDVKKEIEDGDYEAADLEIRNAMKNDPDSGVPHNLMGILQEHRRNHVGAMKHFRAAWALEPTLLCARWNLDVYGGGNRLVKCAYVDDEVPQKHEEQRYKWVYDEKGIGHLTRRQDK